MYASLDPAVVVLSTTPVINSAPSPPFPAVPSPPTQTAVPSPSPAFLKSAASTANIPSASGSGSATSQSGQGSRAAEERHPPSHGSGDVEGGNRQQGEKASGDQERELELTWKAAGSGGAAVDAQQPATEAPPHPALGTVIEVVPSAHVATGSIKSSDIL